MGKGLQSKTSQKKAKQKTKNRSVMSTQQLAPVATARKFKSGKPQVQRTSNGSTRVKHCEFFADIQGKLGSFQSWLPDQQSFYALRVSPTNQTLFPWLSKLSSQYETCSWNSLSFRYEPYCSTQSAGTLMMAVDYDASDLPPKNKSDLMAYQESVRSSVWQECELKATRENLVRHGKWKYNSYLAVGNGLDFAPGPTTGNGTSALIRQNDLGTFYAVAANGGNIGVGELYVCYDVTLETPQTNAEGSSAFLALKSTGPSWFAAVSGMEYVSNFVINVPLTNQLKVDVGLDYALAVFRQKGTGILTAPSFGTATNCEFVTVLASLVNDSMTDAITILTYRGAAGATFTAALGVATTVTDLRFHLVAVPQSAFGYWGGDFTQSS